MKKVLLSLLTVLIVGCCLVACGTKETTTESTTENTTSSDTTTNQDTTSDTTTKQDTTSDNTTNSDTTTNVDTTTEGTTTEDTTTEAPVTYSTTIKIHYLGVLQTRVYNWTIPGDSDNKTFETMGEMKLDEQTGYTYFIRNLGVNTYEEFEFVLVNEIEGTTWVKDVDQNYKVDLTNPTAGVTEVWYNMGDGTAYASLDAAKAAESYSAAYARCLSDYKAQCIAGINAEVAKHFTEAPATTDLEAKETVSEAKTAYEALLATVKATAYKPQYVYELSSGTISVGGVVTGSYDAQKNVCIEYEGYSIDIYFANADALTASGMPVTPGTFVYVTGDLAIFNGLYEVKNVTAVETKEVEYTFVQETVTDLSKVTLEQMSNLYTFTDMLIQAVEGTSITFADLNGNEIVGFKFPALGEDFAVGDYVTFDAYVATYNSNVQLRIADGSALALSDLGKVNRDKAALVIDNEEALYYVGQQLTLPATGANGSEITWVSNKPETLDNTGKVLVLTSEDVFVTLTATIAIGEVKLTKEFEVVVRHAMTDQEKVDSIDLAALLTEKGYNVAGIYNNVVLPTEASYAIAVEWTLSSNTSVLALDGTVVRPTAEQGNATVTLTAKLTLNEAEATKTVDVVVLAWEAGLADAIAAALDEINTAYATQITAAKKYLVLDTTSVENATLIADVTAAKEALIATFADAPYKPEAAYGMTNGTKGVSFVGFYTGKIDAKTYTIEYDGFGVVAYNQGVLDTYTVGTAVKVTGDLAIYKGLYEISNCTVEAITLEGSVEGVELTSVANIKDYLSRVVILKGVTLTSFNKSGNSVLTDADGKTVNWYNAGIDLPSYVQVGDTVTLRVIVGIFTNVQVRTDLIDKTSFIFTDADKVAKDKAALTIENENALTEVGQQITLSSVGTYFESAITWASSNEAVLDNTGKVVALPAAETVVTLTATITLNEVTDTKAFEVTVKPSMTDQQKVDEVKANIKDLFGAEFVFEQVVENVTLPKTDPTYGTAITWVSNKTDVIADDGTVTRPAAGSEAVVVTLTYTITLNEVTVTGTIDFTVLPEPLKGETITYTFPTATADSNSAYSTTALLALFESNPIVTAVTETSKCYAGKSGIKLGSSKAVGSFTITLDTTAGACETITFGMSKYGSETGKLVFTIVLSDDTKAVDAQQVDPSTGTVTFDVNGVIKSITVATTKKRAYLSSMELQMAYVAPTAPEAVIAILPKKELF